MSGSALYGGDQLDDSARQEDRITDLRDPIRLVDEHVRHLRKLAEATRTAGHAGLVGRFYAGQGYVEVPSAWLAEIIDRLRTAESAMQTVAVPNADGLGAAEAPLPRGEPGRARLAWAGPSGVFVVAMGGPIPLRTAQQLIADLQLAVDDPIYGAL